MQTFRTKWEQIQKDDKACPKETAQASFWKSPKETHRANKSRKPRNKGPGNERKEKNSNNRVEFQSYHAFRSPDHGIAQVSKQVHDQTRHWKKSKLFQALAEIQVL